LSGAITFDPVVTKIDADLASRIVWLDCLLVNVDRTCRNTNMLLWHKELWLIDHGASLYFHHSWSDWQNPERTFPNVKDHVLLGAASELEKVDAYMKSRLTKDTISSILATIPNEWLANDPAFDSVEEHRNAYAQFLEMRVAHSTFFIKEAQYARESVI
jgi:hypothetical protein